MSPEKETELSKDENALLADARIENADPAKTETQPK
jgi:hypothetical protein